MEEKELVKFIKLIIDEFNQKIIDKYNSWEGNNYFCCNGKCLIGPNGIKPVILTSVLIIVPYALFLTFCSQVFLI